MIDDDILSLAKIKAQQEKISVGKALNLLARLGLNPPSKSTKKKNGLPVFDVKDKGGGLNSGYDISGRRILNTPNLLDVNFLIALSWPIHVHHEKAHAWFRKNSESQWVWAHSAKPAVVAWKLFFKNHDPGIGGIKCWE